MDDFMHSDDHLLGDAAAHMQEDAAMLQHDALSLLGDLDPLHILEELNGHLGPFNPVINFIEEHLEPQTFHVNPPSLPVEHQPAHPSELPSGMIGNPLHDMQCWHEQTHSDTCAIVSQEFILDSLTGQHWSEDALRQDAIDHGWYIPGVGTPFDDVGKLLEEHGVSVKSETNATVNDLAHHLQQGQHVIIGVNAEDIWNAANHPNTSVSNYPGIPGQKADHAVEVIGIDDRDPAHPIVILNDSGTPNGQGERVPLAVFEQAWKASSDLMVYTTA